MLLARVVAASDEVASTSSRTEKIALLATVIGDLETHEIAAVVSWLAGEARQGRVGVGWATVASARRLEAASPPVPSITVSELDRFFDDVVVTTGAGSVERREALLRSLFSRASAAEASFIKRIIVGELRQGALEGVVVDAVARAAGVSGTSVRRALMLGGDLGQTARLALEGGSAALAEVRLELLRPIRPMLASTADGVGSALGALGPCSVEWKLDGARIQVHRRGDEIKVFTRNLNDITHRAPEVVAVTAALPVESVLLDGETLALDDEGRPRAFQDTMSRFGADEARDERLRVFFFDCLHLDGRDLIDEPLSERRAVLEAVTGTSCIPGVLTDDASVGEQVLAEALAAGHEGVVVKAASSPYEAGRRGKAWQKVKPVRTFDLVVLAAEWGHGRRRGWLSNLHLGARDPDGDGFVMVGKTFKGMTDEVLRWQTEHLSAIEVERRGIEVHVRPEMVVEIALDGVQSSRRYPGGVALRFARLVGYRTDKRADECDTIDALRALLSNQGALRG